MKKRPIRKNRTTSGTTRRAFLKQSLAFAALTSTYSVISLTDLACNQGDSTTGLNGNYVNGNYFGEYFENDYFDQDHFFFYY